MKSRYNESAPMTTNPPGTRPPVSTTLVLSRFASRLSSVQGQHKLAGAILASLGESIAMTRSTC